MTESLKAVTDGLAVFIREEIARQLAEQHRTNQNPDEVLKASRIAIENGMSTDAIAGYCKRKLIEGAYRHGGKGNWWFTRAAWDDFKKGHNIRPRRRRSVG